MEIRLSTSRTKIAFFKHAQAKGMTNREVSLHIKRRCAFAGQLKGAGLTFLVHAYRYQSRRQPSR